ncbi:cupin domain-containing protein [Microbacterium sp. LWH12-1.2]|uniref:cupin domain-containing protein n=1 Tax=Microbacterium sp. LWH12-1.2 TaxID=3135259 RepID=UPI003439A9C7
MTTTFPGGTSVSFLAVYDDKAPDGLRGGSPHVHLASTECYTVTDGRGRLQTIDRHGFRETLLEPGSVVWFTPGTIHRAVNDHDLRAIVIMSNAGLPEAGDAVLTFPEDIVASETAYRSAATLPEGDDSTRRAAAARRRDLAVEGFLALRNAVERHDPGPLEAFYSAAAALVRDEAQAWDDVVRSNALEQSHRALALVAAAAQGDSAFLHEAELRHAPATADAALGMCGRLRKFDTAATHLF